MTALLQEIVLVYPALAPPSLTGHASNRVCNALALLQCVASHNDTRGLFLNGLYTIECVPNKPVTHCFPLTSPHTVVFVPILEHYQ
jgi:CCR4-NOT transcription complex subunit 9